MIAANNVPPLSAVSFLNLTRQLKWQEAAPLLVLHDPWRDGHVPQNIRLESTWTQVRPYSLAARDRFESLQNEELNPWHRVVGLLHNDDTQYVLGLRQTPAARDIGGG
jgi:hypothetical protein